MIATASPSTKTERITLLDIVRGFAVLGILIMNMPGFSSSFFSEADGSRLWPSWYDQAAETLRNMLFSGKFNGMFSMLFGLGFTLQLQRLMAIQPAEAIAIYRRRLLILLLMGLLHFIVLWPGDILHWYALLGLALLLIRDVSNRTIWVLLITCLLVPSLISLIMGLISTPEIVAARVAEANAVEVSNNLAYGHGTFLEASIENARMMAIFYGSWNQLLSTFDGLLMIAVTMLLGVLIGRYQLVQRIPEFLPRLKRLQWQAFAVGIICAAIFGVVFQFERTPGPSLLKLIAGNAYVICRLALMIFYILVIVRLAQLPSWQARFAPFAAVGRMPLTNYLMQTVICTSLFYGWGFGLWGKVGPALGLALSFAIYFAIQVPFSLWWQARFEYGPLEWLWRAATYGRLPAWRRSNQAAHLATGE